jgi:tight adherence protein C
MLFSGNSLMLLIASGLGLYLPRWYVKKKRQERQFDLLCDFPTAIDMIVLGLEGGLDIAAGIKETLDNANPGPLREELERLHGDMAMGVSRSEAFRRMNQRVDPIEIRTVITSLVQAMEMGSEIGSLLRVQSEQLRFNRFNRAEEAANKAPTKMMIPMALFILPCMFLVIFAPLAISIIQSFKSVN